MPPRGLAVFDLDRTLVQGASAHVLGDVFGFRPRLKAMSAERDAGRLTQQQVTEGVALLLAGRTPAELAPPLAAMPWTPGARRAVAGLREAGVAVALCSDFFSVGVAPRAREVEADLWAANVLEERDGRFTGALLPWARALVLGDAARTLDKREALPLLARKAGVPLERTAVVGDGDQDALAMGLAGLGIAFEGTPKARAAAAHTLEGSLAPVPALVLDWLATAK